jgi:hypothetical protein
MRPVKQFAATLAFFVVALPAIAKAAPDNIEHFWMFRGPGGNYGVQQLCSVNNPDDAYTVFAFADHFYRVPFRITTMAAPVGIGVLVMTTILLAYRRLRRRKA